MVTARQCEYHSSSGGGRCLSNWAHAGRGREGVSASQLARYHAPPREGDYVQTARALTEDLLVAEIGTAPRRPRRGWDSARNPHVMEQYVRHVTGGSAA